MMRKDPVTMIDSHINGETMSAFCGTGFVFHQPAVRASEQRANAASVSMMILIQRIWTMVNGSG